MATPSIRLAKPADTELIVQYLTAMQAEVGDFTVDAATLRQQVNAAAAENAFWFIFLDDTGAPFGTCALQSVYNYWRVGKRFLVSGLYIQPSHRPGGHFKKVGALLKEWATTQGGVMFNSIISDHNRRSILACQGLGMKPLEEHKFYYVAWE